MGLIGKLLELVFGKGRNVVAETAEVFRVNAEAQDARAAGLQSAALEQLAAEFARERRGWFDRMIDGMNRLPRPAMALGTLGLFVAAMVDPVWFAARMQGLALVPEPLWWLLGVIVSFYFGARYQAKSQEFQRSLGATLARTPDIVAGIRALHNLGDAELKDDPSGAKGPDDANPALEDWRRQNRAS